MFCSLLKFFDEPASTDIRLSLYSIASIVFRRHVVPERRVLHQQFVVLVEAAVVLAAAAAALVSVVLAVTGRVAMALLNVRVLHDLVGGLLVSLGRDQLLEPDNGADDECDFADN